MGSKGLVLVPLYSKKTMMQKLSAVKWAFTTCLRRAMGVEGRDLIREPACSEIGINNVSAAPQKSSFVP